MSSAGFEIYDTNQNTWNNMTVSGGIDPKNLMKLLS